jgi:hypothetical protein
MAAPVKGAAAAVEDYEYMSGFGEGVSRVVNILLIFCVRAQLAGAGACVSFDQRAIVHAMQGVQLA